MMMMNVQETILLQVSRKSLLKGLLGSDDDDDDEVRSIYLPLSVSSIF